MTDVQIRPVRDGEIGELIDLLCRVFDPEGHDRYRGYIEGDPTWIPEQSRVAVCNGRLVAALRVWDRHVHVGPEPVRMGGIGGVGTAPEYRGRGIAGELMRDTAGYLREEAFDVGVLFTLIPARFYRRLGWSSVGLTGFRAELRFTPTRKQSRWRVEAFEEERDLDGVAGLYERHNAGRSGSLLRPRAYWDWAPSRARGVLPTAVARRGDRLGGYLNHESGDTAMHVREVAWDDTEPGALRVLVDHLLEACREQGITTVLGSIPAFHPFVEALVAAADADCVLTGDSAMMALLPDPSRLLGRVCPAADGALAGIPADLLARLLFGESSWAHIEPVLRHRGVAIETGADPRGLFPQREVVFWVPDHF